VCCNLAQRDPAGDRQLVQQAVGLIKKHPHNARLRFALVDLLETMDPTKAIFMRKMEER
jgi:hypothetical protein